MDAGDQPGPREGGSGADAVAVVVGEGRVAELLRAAFGGRGPQKAPVEPNDLSAPWIEGVRTLVVVAPAGEFGVRAAKGESRRTHLVDQAVRVARAAVRHGVEQLVAVTSATVHGASADRAVIEDDDPVSPDAAGFVADLVAFEDALVEGLAAASAESPTGPAVRLAVLRPAMVVGPGVDTILTRHFEAPRLLTVKGSDRPWQLLHTDDLASAVGVVVAQGLSGTFTVGALVDGEPDVVTPAELVERTGLANVTLPAATAFGAAERLHRVGVLPSPASDLAYVVHPWTVTARGLHAAGWEPAWSSARSVDALMEGVRGRVALGGRRVGGRDAAALGAAGAAVALLGTAAIWRQARRR
ncbi:nucleoside-diphosphate sugar epimerase [Oerskovia turbata]|uniref:Nucleoside-diphosphate sugar epimerase n=1 Tax=Oerskovia turbata TaxID=1713 RepID=A0A4Q1L087_9CELL|nr:nucleoside-diphosphate sugar epimerase [Oerskovia turbata]RXR27286.1 nucleoside-diphosphate sugar epimerase [Oerskovia turbata]RXR36140.1 nucleoside-diphosphate sugar epimerase [Oerskovia turbata]